MSKKHPTLEEMVQRFQKYTNNTVPLYKLELLDVLDASQRSFRTFTESLPDKKVAFFTLDKNRPFDPEQILVIGLGWGAFLYLDRRGSEDPIKSKKDLSSYRIGTSFPIPWWLKMSSEAYTEIFHKEKRYADRMHEDLNIKYALEKARASEIHRRYKVVNDLGNKYISVKEMYSGRSVLQIIVPHDAEFDLFVQKLNDVYKSYAKK